MDLNDLQIELDLLREDQIIGSNRLEIFDKIGEKAAITDYAIALGGYVAPDCFIKGGENQLECRSGYYWTKTWDGGNDVHVVSCYGDSYDYDIRNRYVGIRVTLPYSAISKIASNEVTGPDGVVQLEAGYLPKKIASKPLQKELTGIYYQKKEIYKRNEFLKEIKKKYTVDSKNYDEHLEKFDPEQLDEMELTNGKKYTRVIIKGLVNKNVKFSNGESYQVGEAVWMERYPVIWYKDLETDVVFNKDIIMAGIPFSHKKIYKGGFPKTEMYEYLNTYLKRDLFSSYLKDADFEPKQGSDLSIIEQLENRNAFLESEIERMQQEINQNNQAIENYGKGYAKVHKKK